jgi:pancreatic triacylglycerol lipase
VAAHIGRGIQLAGLGKIGRITALDPARPWFDGENRPLRINKNDAEFVDVIHTNSGIMLEVST